MTEGAQRFVTPLTFQALTKRPVRTDIYADWLGEDTGHVGLAHNADILVVAPATAHTIARLALGLSDDLLSAVYLSTQAPVLIVPAMESGMYLHPATQEHLQTLKSRGATVLAPAEGHLASGATGVGRLPEPPEIIAAIARTLGRNGPLAGKRVVVTAGGTQEPLDPVRFIGNGSSGKMGYAIAEAARDRGAEVVLVTTPTALRVPAGMQTLHVQSTLQMLDAISECYAQLDALIMVAAVADFRVEAPAAHKVKHGEHALDVRLVPNPDLLATTAALPSPKRIVRVGFAAETQDLLEHASEKLARKRLDLIVANDVSGDVFGADANEVSLLWSDGRRLDLPRLPKTAVAEQVLDAVSALLRPA
jgi:phosphopantothenoylcysteine decarboxylase/phosphopantothenate--cysteine ligase